MSDIPDDWARWTPDFITPYVSKPLARPGKSLPSGWREYRFRYGTAPEGCLYFAHRESTVVTPFNVGTLEPPTDENKWIRDLFEAETRRAILLRDDDDGEQLEFIFAPPEKEGGEPVRATIDHLKQEIALPNGMQSDGYPPYYEWLRHTYQRHMLYSDIGKVAAMTELEKCQIGQARIFTLEQADRLLDLIQLPVDFCMSNLKRPGPTFMKLRIVKRKTWYWEWSYIAVANGLFFRLPYLYRSRLDSLCHSHHRNLIDRWDGFLPSLVNEWNRLNVVLALLLSGSGAFLAVLPSDAAVIPRLFCLASTFFSLSGVIHTLVLLGIHQPSVSTDLIVPGSSAGVDQAIAYIRRTDLDLLSLILSIPVVHVVWSIFTFAASVATWSFYDPLIFQLLASVSLIIMMTGPLISVWFFWGLWEWARTKNLDDGWDYDPNNAGELLVKSKHERQKKGLKMIANEWIQHARRRSDSAAHQDEENQGSSGEKDNPERPMLRLRLSSLLSRAPWASS
ncbi:hypothetical protein FRB98_001852 [Tulasnella sp. 332]|nr:hypothetical protein FRB98_001852 [Tulasnella sp. 332]